MLQGENLTSASVKREIQLSAELPVVFFFLLALFVYAQQCSCGTVDFMVPWLAV